MIILRKIPKILFFLFFIVGEIFASSSSNFQIQSPDIVTSDTVEGTSNNYKIQSRSKSEQTSGKSGNFQIYSSFDTNTKNFILGTNTLVDGNVSSLGSTLNDDTSTSALRDDKSIHLSEVPELNDEISFLNTIADADTFVITKKSLNFVQANIIEPILIFPVDRITNDSRKIMIGLPKGLSMNTSSANIGNLTKETLPSIPNFASKYAIKIPTNTPILFSGNIEVCMYGTPDSTGISNAENVDIFYSHDEINWSQNFNPKNKKYISTSEQFCFETKYLASFVIGEKQLVVAPPSEPDPPPNPSNPPVEPPISKPKKRGSNSRYGWNPQSIYDENPTRDKSYRLSEEMIDEISKLFVQDKSPEKETSEEKAEDPPKSNNKKNTFYFPKKNRNSLFFFEDKNQAERICRNLQNLQNQQTKKELYSPFSFSTEKTSSEEKNIFFLPKTGKKGGEEKLKIFEFSGSIEEKTIPKEKNITPPKIQKKETIFTNIWKLILESFNFFWKR